MNVSDPAFVPLPRQTGRDAWCRRREAEPLSATTLPHDVQKAAPQTRLPARRFRGMGIVSGPTIQEKHVPAVVNRPTLEMSVLLYGSAAALRKHAYRSRSDLRSQRAGRSLPSPLNDGMEEWSRIDIGLIAEPANVEGASGNASDLSVAKAGCKLPIQNKTMAASYTKRAWQP